MDARLRVLEAGNQGPFTLDGTRTWIVGDRAPAVIDPGPDVDSHVRAVSSALGGAERVTVLLTHGHADHAGATDALLRSLEGAGCPAQLLGSGHSRARAVSSGERIPTDAGDLEAVPTPGHTRDHVAFLWAARRALFAGDLVLGRGDTTWVAEYPGCVADYLRSLDVVRALDLDVIHPAHGPSIHDPAATLDRYEAHRRARLDEVRRARGRMPGATVDQLLDAVYGGEVPAGMRPAARRSLEALVHHLDSHGEAGG